MPEFQFGTFTATLGIMFQKGLRFSTVIDLGCADGQFYVEHYYQGLLPGSLCVNVDANAMYEGSLRKIQDTVGGHYVIAAVSDRDGDVDLQLSGHPYWASLLPADHSYWSLAHNRPAEKIRVRAFTLDTLVRDLKLRSPFLLKLDLQGGELKALKGAEKVLAETDAIILETHPDEFPSVCAFLDAQHFGLIDLTLISRATDGTVCEFYPVFLNRRRDDIRMQDGFGPEAGLVRQMDERRARILDKSAELLAEIRKNGPLVLRAS